MCPSLTNRPGVAQAHENTKRNVTDGDRYMAARAGIKQPKGLRGALYSSRFLGCQLVSTRLLELPNARYV